MIINFDEYKDDEPITIIENGISKTYIHPIAKLSYNPCFPHKNGTLCCHGDKVKFQYDEGFYNGTLTFNFTFKCFTIVTEDGGVFFWTNGAIKWFEKVE